MNYCLHLNVIICESTAVLHPASTKKCPLDLRKTCVFCTFDLQEAPTFKWARNCGPSGIKCACYCTVRIHFTDMHLHHIRHGNQ